jgi:hypothetical protein
MRRLTLGAHAANLCDEQRNDTKAHTISALPQVPLRSSTETLPYPALAVVCLWSSVARWAGSSNVSRSGASNDSLCGSALFLRVVYGRSGAQRDTGAVASVRRVNTRCGQSFVAARCLGCGASGVETVY